MATTQDTQYVGNDESGLAKNIENMNLAEQGQADEAHGLANGEQEHEYANGNHANYAAPYDEGVAHNEAPVYQETTGRESALSEYPQSEARPS